MEIQFKKEVFINQNWFYKPMLDMLKKNKNIRQ